jgi:MoaA/NifB/PqqE/SkfB family radical SAM enzyme
MLAAHGARWGESLRKIKKAYVEITNACNRSCAFCPGTARRKAFMAAEEFERVINELAGKVQCLYFHVMGEPLLHPQLGLFLDIAHSARFPVNITTNGTLLGGQGDMLLAKPALRQVNISLHSLFDDEAGRQALDDALLFARKAAGDGRVTVAFRLWNEQGGGGNPENLWMLSRLFAEYGVQRVSLDGAADGRGVRLARGVYLNLAEPFEWPGLEAREHGGTGFCMGLRDQIGILCDGTVVPCCLDAEGNLALGNLFSQTLDEILSLGRAQAIYNGFSRRTCVEELCRKCGYRKRFDIRPGS